METKRKKLSRGWVVALTVAVLAVSFILLPIVISLFLPVELSWFLAIIIWLVIAFLLDYLVLARYNVFSTIIKEGTAKIIVKGGAVVDILPQWAGHTCNFRVNPNCAVAVRWKIVEETDGAKEPWHPFGGFRPFYGLWPLLDVFIHKFRWTTIREDGKEDPNEEWQDFVLLLAATYKQIVTDCEDKNALNLTLEIILTLQIEDPYKAKFLIQDWLEYTKNQVLAPFIRGYITQDEYALWLTKKGILGPALLKEFGDSGQAAGLKDDYGILVKKIEVKQINPSDPAMREVTLKRYIAEKSAEAVIASAKGESERIKIIYGAISDFGDLGRLVKTLESVAQSTLAASIAVQAIPGLPEMLRGVFGKSPEGITKDDIRELIQELREKPGEVSKEKEK